MMQCNSSTMPMETATEGSGYVYGTLGDLKIVVASLISFIVLSSILYVFGWIPTSAEKSYWKWKNIFLSFLHAVISGVGAILCFYHTPGLAEDMIDTHSAPALTLISFSIGYFLYDSADMLKNKRSRQSFELILHHFVIILAFTIAVTLHQFVGYAVVALLVEINSVFLHLRQLMLICGYRKDNKLYRLNSLFNFATYIVFRVATLAWMTRWIVINRDLVPLLYYSIGSVGLAIITLMNIVLFYRLLRSDLLYHRETTQKMD